MKKTLQYVFVFAISATLFACSKTAPNHPAPVVIPGNGGQQPIPQQPETITIGVKAVIMIGKVVYDSIPATFTLLSYDSTGQAHVKNVQLQPGTNMITIPARHLRYRLLVERWGMQDEMVLDRNNIQEHTVYILGGARAAKLLRYEQKSVLVNGAYKVIGRTEYTYDQQGQLVKVAHLSKRDDGTIKTDATEELITQQGKVVAVIKRDSLDQEWSRLQISYDQQGKIIAIKDVSGGIETQAAITYTITPNGVETGIKYRYSNTPITMDYWMLFNNGNLIRGSSVTANNNSELANYIYDEQINPYIHMNWPNLYLSNQSKNNANWQRKEYYGAYPVSEAYNFRYTYSSDGYPSSLLKDHRTYLNGTYTHTTKTTYHY